MPWKHIPMFNSTPCHEDIWGSKVETYSYTYIFLNSVLDRGGGGCQLLSQFNTLKLLIVLVSPHKLSSWIMWNRQQLHHSQSCCHLMLIIHAVHKSLLNKQPTDIWYIILVMMCPQSMQFTSMTTEVLCHPKAFSLEFQGFQVPPRLMNP